MLLRREGAAPRCVGRAFTRPGDPVYPAAMSDVVNLNRVRKARARAEEAATAAANRVKHGRTGAEKANDRRAEARRAALLDGARRDDAPAARAGTPETKPPGTDRPA